MCSCTHWKSNIKIRYFTAISSIQRWFFLSFSRQEKTPESRNKWELVSRWLLRYFTLRSLWYFRFVSKWLWVSMWTYDNNGTKHKIKGWKYQKKNSFYFITLERQKIILKFHCSLQLFIYQKKIGSE